MVSDLLEVTRAESGKLNVDLRCVYLTELIPQILKTYQLANTKDYTHIRSTFLVISPLSMPTRTVFGRFLIICWITLSNSHLKRERLVSGRRYRMKAPNLFV